MKSISPILFSIVFAGLIMLVPWEMWRGINFVDKEVYLDYAYYQINILEYRDFSNYLSYISNEWLWHFSISKVGQYIPYEMYFNAISFTTITLMAHFLIKRHGYLSILLLLNPLVIDLVMSQYRISLATCFILLAVNLTKYKKTALLLVVAALLTHTSVSIFIATYIAILILEKINFKHDWVQVIILFLMGASISFILSGYINLILEALGDRRAGYRLSNISSSLSFLSFWIVNCGALILNYMITGLKSRKDKISIVILSLVTANVVFSGYSSRILAVFLPVIMSSNLSLSKQLRVIIIPIYILYCASQWYYWFPS